MAAAYWNKVVGFSAMAAPAGTPRGPLEEEVVALFEQLRTPVLRYLSSLRIAAPDAEEIAQEVFLLLFRHLQQRKSKANLQGWVFRVAHNLALKHRAKLKQHSEHLVHPETIEQIGGQAPGPEESLQLAQRQRTLLAIVRAMPEQDQWCLSLRAEGLRYREIAEVLEISLGSVANSLERSLSKLAAGTR